jgi:hypothetical protein
MKRVLVLVVLASLVSGCASSSWSDVSQRVGRTGLASGALFREARAVVFARDSDAMPGCAERRITKRVLVDAPEVIVTPYADRFDAPFSGTGTPGSYAGAPESRYSTFSERWTLTRCGADASYLVLFTPAGAITRVEATLETANPKNITP